MGIQKTSLDNEKIKNILETENKYDLKYAPHIYLLQLVSSTYGYKEYNEDFEQNELINFAFFRTKICKSLYNNLEELSSKLIKDKNE